MSIFKKKDTEINIATAINVPDDVYGLYNYVVRTINTTLDNFIDAHKDDISIKANEALNKMINNEDVSILKDKDKYYRYIKNIYDELDKWKTDTQNFFVDCKSTKEYQQLIKDNFMLMQIEVGTFMTNNKTSITYINRNIGDEFVEDKLERILIKKIITFIDTIIKELKINLMY